MTGKGRVPGSPGHTPNVWLVGRKKHARGLREKGSQPGKGQSNGNQNRWGEAPRYGLGGPSRERKREEIQVSGDQKRGEKPTRSKRTGGKSKRRSMVPQDHGNCPRIQERKEEGATKRLIEKKGGGDWGTQSREKRPRNPYMGKATTHTEDHTDHMGRGPAFRSL